ncbi:MAG TPA: carnitine dehydratase, partial [Gammaproteobacteria bacterium]|nr:carnitine dehydratase [Gammaproteobacteria bacterium]
EAIGSWALAHTAAEVIAALEAAEVPVGLIYDVADAQADPQYQAREMFEEVAVGASRMTIPAMAPKLSATPGRTRWAGPEVGVDTEQVLADAGYSRDEINTLRESGDI